MTSDQNRALDDLMADHDTAAIARNPETGILTVRLANGDEYAIERDGDIRKLEDTQTKGATP